MIKINWTIPPFTSTHLRGYYESPWTFEETIARLITASGQPAKSSDDYKTSVDFVGTFDGERFTLYDYKEDRQLHIGGNDKLDVASLAVALTSTLQNVEPTSYVADEYYDERKGHAFRA